MGETYRELKRRVSLRLARSDGLALLAISEAVNDAHTAIARARDFDCLMQTEEDAVTVADQKSYALVTDWGLVRPKDIHTIRLIDGTLSRKLNYVPVRIWDKNRPYPEAYDTTNRSWYYTRRGDSVELFPIPDDEYSVYVYYSQWPVALSSETDESVFGTELTDVIVALASEMASAILGGESGANWVQKAAALLGSALHEESVRPDRRWVAQGYDSGEGMVHGEYWKDPFVRNNP